MRFHCGQQWVGGAIEKLQRRDVRHEKPVGGELSHRLLVAEERRRRFHLIVPEQVAHAVGTIQRATDDMIQTKARLPILDRIG